MSIANVYRVEQGLGTPSFPGEGRGPVAPTAKLDPGLRRGTLEPVLFGWIRFPAKAGTQSYRLRRWTPAFAGER